jgi:hypothetical protein
MDLPVSGRGRREERVLLDALVELRSENGDEVMEADGLDLGPGGLSMRAPFVPEPGVRLVCHFRCPPMGEPVEAHSEVVWSAWEGPRSGAFGVRFLELDTRGAMAIRRFLSPGAEAEFAAANATPTAVAATMVIDGLAAPIEADLRLSDDTRIVLEQELTFLRLGRGVDVDIPGKGKQRGRIASVELRPGPLNVPTLVFGVLVDQPVPDSVLVPVSAQVATTPRSAELPSEFETMTALEAVDRPNEAPKAAVMPTMIVEGMEEAVIAHTSSVDTWPERPIFTDATGVPAEPPAKPASSPAGRDETCTFYVQPGIEGEPSLSAEEHAEVDAFSSRLSLPGLGSAWRQALTVLESMRATVRTLFTMLRTLLVRYFGERIAVTFRQVSALLRASKSADKAKLRTTAAPPRHVKTAPILRETKPADSKSNKPRNHRLRALALAAAGLGLGVYALAPRSGAKLNAQPIARTVSADAVSLLPSAGSTEPSTSLASTVPTPPAAVDTSTRAPAAVAIGSGPTKDQLSPAPVEASTGEAGLSKTFGAAEVPDGRSFILRMSGPVEGLEGDARGDGFTVRVPGRLALDRASPIATSHRAVARAMILNRGDYAELTVDFLPGMKPKYRVMAKDNAIEVTLERL